MGRPSRAVRGVGAVLGGREPEPLVRERVCECTWCEPFGDGLWAWEPRTNGSDFVVRCKDCRHFRDVRGEPYCLRLAVETDPGGFCHRGERRREKQ